MIHFLERWNANFTSLIQISNWCDDDKYWIVKSISNLLCWKHDLWPIDWHHFFIILFIDKYWALSLLTKRNLCYQFQMWEEFFLSQMWNQPSKITMTIWRNDGFLHKEIFRKPGKWLLLIGVAMMQDIIIQ